MPALPTITVTDAQAQRMLGAYGSVENYLKWLTESIVGYVLDSEFERDHRNFVDSANARREQSRKELLG